MDHCKETFRNILDEYIKNLKNESGLTDDIVEKLQSIEGMDKGGQQANMDPQ